MSEIERQVLAKMTNPDEITRIHDMGLTAEAFEDLDCRNAYDWVIRYWQNNAMQIAPTHAVMAYEFPRIRLPDEVTEATDWLVTTLKDRLIVNGVNEAVMEAGKLLHDDPMAATSALWQRLYDVTERVTPRTARSDMSNVDEREARYQSRKAATVGGIGYGMPALDDHTHGILPGELAMTAAFTKIGKSFLLCKMMASAHLAGYRPILYSLEMSIKEMEDRIDAFYSGAPYGGIISGEMMPSQEDDLRAAREQLASMDHKMRIERPQRGERTVKHLVNRARQVDADLILIDQLSFMDASADRRYASDNSGMRMKHGDIVFELKDEIARESVGAIPCMLAVQLNRDSQRSGDGRGQLHNLANSSFIEQTADIVLGLWRNDDMRNSNLMGMDIMGSRRSDKMSWLLNWRLNDRTDVSIQREYDD